jgi:hypothetical protein
VEAEIGGLVRDEYLGKIQKSKDNHDCLPSLKIAPPTNKRKASTCHIGGKKQEKEREVATVAELAEVE